MVFIIYDDSDELLHKPWCTSVITTPAVNYGTLKGHEKPLAETTMRQRIDRVLAIACKHQYKNIILGAWGCGVVRNNPQLIARYFRDALLEYGTFYNAFEKVRFSVLDRSNSMNTLNTFKDILKKE